MGRGGAFLQPHAGIVLNRGLMESKRKSGANTIPDVLLSKKIGNSRICLPGLPFGGISTAT
jgi:hypothetical protein